MGAARTVVRLMTMAAFAGALCAAQAQGTVVSLMHMDGSDGSTTFTDEVGGTWSAVGAGTEIKTTQAKFGTASLRPQGYIENSDTTALELGASTPFTIDFWVYVSTKTSAGQYLVGKSNPDAGKGYDIRVESDRIAVYGINNWLPGFYSNAGTILTETWHHVALIGDATQCYLFVDGDHQATSNRNINTQVGDRGFRMGDQLNYGGHPLYGYIDEFRFVSGEAVWTDDFTPPTSPYGTGSGVVPEPLTMLGMTLSIGCIAGYVRKRRVK